MSLFILAQGASMWGQFFTLKYKNISMLEAFMRAIPFAWIYMGFMSMTIYVGDRFSLVTPTQDTLLLIILQFMLILGINSIWLEKRTNNSDIFCFLIILSGFYISFTNQISKAFGLKYPKKDDKSKDDNSKNEGNPIDCISKKGLIKSKILYCLHGRENKI
jgi:hypothetical protein